MGVTLGVHRLTAHPNLQFEKQVMVKRSEPKVTEGCTRGQHQKTRDKSRSTWDSQGSERTITADTREQVSPIRAGSIDISESKTLSVKLTGNTETNVNKIKQERTNKLDKTSHLAA